MRKFTVVLALLLLTVMITLPSCSASVNNNSSENSNSGMNSDTNEPDEGVENDTYVETSPKKDKSEDEQPKTESQTQEDIIMKEIENYNYIIGTQAFAPNYQFTDEPALIEIGTRICKMGSNMIKFHAMDEDTVDELLENEKIGSNFKYVFMWYRTDSPFRDGYSDSEAQEDYNAMYAYTKKLLEKYSGTGIEFYIGHWEGDWYYLDNFDMTQKNVSNVITEGMTAWINNRQKAIDDAKRDTPHNNVEVWNYLELNQPVAALKNADWDRVVNRVLPNANVDYVSYSSYDVMDSNAKMVERVIDMIYQNLQPKDGVPGPRVFIGELGQPAVNQNYNGDSHRDVNLKNIAKFLACDVKFVLYWQMYDNEQFENGTQKGFWLINDKNETQPLYYAFESVLAAAKEHVRKFYEENGRVPTNEEYRAWLLTLPEFAG